MSDKGDAARVEFDDHDHICLGRVFGLRAVIGVHGETVAPSGRCRTARRRQG